MTDVNAAADARTAMAGELALGLLDGTERAEALRLMLSDRAFAAEVERWRARTGDLYDGVGEVPPPPALWDGIAAGIAGGGALGGAVPPPLTWRSGGMIAGGALAAGIAMALAISPLLAPTTAPAAATSYAVAQLTGDIAGLRVAARYDRASATLRLRTTGMPDTPTAPVLWLVPADGVPRPLGQIARDGETVLAVAVGHQALINPAATLALSMEPPSAIGAANPSAPMVARGAIDLI